MFEAFQAHLLAIDHILQVYLRNVLATEACCQTGVSGASRVLDTDPETEDVQQPGAAQEAAVLEQRLTVKDVGLKYLLHSSQPQGNLRNVKQT